MCCLSWQEWYIKLPKCGGGAPHNHHTEEASSRVPRGVACLGDKCWAGCWSQLKQSSSLCTVGTLRLEWHAFGCFYYLYKPKSWSVSRHTARLSLWIMNSNEAFCMIIWWVIWMQSSFGDVGEKNNTGCVWMAFFWCMAFPLWFIILIYPIWKANRLIFNDRLFCFCMKKTMMVSLKEVWTAKGHFFLKI